MIDRQQIGAFIHDRVWAILPAYLDWIRAAAIGKVAVDAPQAFLEQEFGVDAARTRRPKQINGAVTIMPLRGVMVHRPSMFLDFFGGVSTEQFGKSFDQVAADETVGAIILDIDTPGGEAYGLQELSERIFNARNGKRPIIAVANDLMASAGYYVGSAADEVVVVPGGEAGSVGTLYIHTEISKARSEAGITDTIITFGENKAEEIPLEPLTDKARDEIQGRVDEYGRQFVADVARNRGVSRANVMKDFGQGRMVQGKEAIRRGIADRVATMDEVLQALGVKPAPPENAMRAYKPHASVDLKRKRAHLTRAR